MRVGSLALVLVVAAGCSEAPATTTVAGSPRRNAAVQYATSALRALEGTEFEVLGAAGLGGLVVDLCEGLGVGAIGVAAADTGIDAPDEDVTILLEVLRTGLDQVCPEQVAVDLAAIYLEAVSGAAESAGAIGAFDEIAVIRAAPVVCDTLDSGEGPEEAVQAAVWVLYGVRVDSADGLGARIGEDRGVVTGAVLAAATALVCPEHLGAVESFLEAR